MMLIKRDFSRTQITSLKRCKAEGPTATATATNEPLLLLPPIKKRMIMALGHDDEREPPRARVDPSPSQSKKKNNNPLWSLEELEVGQVVWARATKSSVCWPAIVVDPRQHASQCVLNACQPSTVCVMYLSLTPSGTRDFGWIRAGNIFPFLDNVDTFQAQRVPKLRPRFLAAIEEAFLAERGFFDLDSLSAAAADEDAAAAAPPSTRTCKGCERTISFSKNRKSEFDRRLCIPCAKLYKDKRYCGVCEKVWYDTDAASFAQCDGCDIWVHSDCITMHTPEELKNIKYFCPSCMAKGKKKAVSITPSSVDKTRCEKETLKAELHDTIPVYIEKFEGVYFCKEHMILCKCNECNGRKLTPARFETHTGSRRKNWKLIVKVKGTDIKLDDLLNGKKPTNAKTIQRNAPTTMIQKLEDLLQEPYTPVHARWTTEMCAICRWVEDWDYNKIIICNRCEVAVHQECYGAKDVKDLTSWVCRACEGPQSQSPLKRNCCLCPIKGGALKRTNVGDFWVHVTCTWFQPNMSFLDPHAMEPAVGLLTVPFDSFNKMCVICDQVHGACTKCCKCNLYYHAMCAARAGYHMELHTYISQGKQISRFDSYCPDHGDVNKKNALVLHTKDAVFSSMSMTSERNDARPTCARLVRKDMENQNQKTSSLAEADLASTSSQEEGCARCRVYEKTNRKRKREEAVPHRTMGPRHHSLDAIESLNLPPNELDQTHFASLVDRLQHLKIKENHRVCRGKSGIHGWGLFARRPIQAGEMIIEYRGERIRCKVSDAREALYRKEKKDCYFFRISDEFVLDATMKGNVARLINHSCQPNCYARILTLHDMNRIVFVAKEDIHAGQELTFDYMFNMDESDENRVKCLCQAPNCRGYMA